MAAGLQASYACGCDGCGCDYAEKCLTAAGGTGDPCMQMLSPLMSCKKQQRKTASNMQTCSWVQTLLYMRYDGFQPCLYIYVLGCELFVAQSQTVPPRQILSIG